MEPGPLLAIIRGVTRLPKAHQEIREYRESNTESGMSLFLKFLLGLILYPILSFGFLAFVGWIAIKLLKG